MSNRFFTETPITDPTATLTGGEAHHLLHVLRAKVGVSVTLFDGGGAEYSATVTKLGRSEVELAIERRVEINRELAIPLTLAVALPKGDRQKWLVEKATELGAARLIPLRTERGVAQPVDSALNRLRRGVIEASKQCGRNVLMRIDAPRAWEEIVVARPAQNLLRVIAHPGGAPLSTIHQIPDIKQTPPPAKTSTPTTSSPTTSSTTNLPGGLLAAIGPEGGFTDEEVLLAETRGWRKVSLGSSILRIETAALALAAWARMELSQ